MEIEDSRIQTLRLLAISEPFSAAPLLFYAEDLLRYPALTTHIRPDQTLLCIRSAIAKPLITV